MSYQAPSYDITAYTTAWGQDTQSDLGAKWWEDICPCEDITPHSSRSCKTQRRRPTISSPVIDSPASPVSSSVKSPSSAIRFTTEAVFTFPSPVPHVRTPRSIPGTSPAMSSRSGRSSGSHGSRSSRKSRSNQSSNQQLIESLQTHRVNTLTELCRIERVAATCDDEEDARAFQEPMTSAWVYYVNSNQFLTEMRGLTRNYPISGELVNEAHRQVRNDPESNRSWNLAWLCLTKMRDDGLISVYAQSDAWKKEMWGGRDPTQDEADQLAQCFEFEWTTAVDNMLRHWTVAPTWY